MRKKGIKSWSIAEIIFENDLFIHTNSDSFFGKTGADKTLFIMQGLKWTGSNKIDDFFLRIFSRQF